SASAPKVGPPHGAVLVVGGGVMSPSLWAKFIALAGGPNALIVDVPTAGGDSVYPQDWSGTRTLKAAGARNVFVLHTLDRAMANSDSFVAPLTHAGGVWFEGGRQWHLVDSYAGTKTEQAFHDVLSRGGVVGGSSAGASILASFLVRGARQGNTVIVAPDYEKGFGFLRGVGIDQHVVARERLADLADSVMPRFPELLGMSEDEGTAWLVQGDTATIIGRNKAFVYGGHDATDSGKPFLTLHPGDRYDLAARHVVHRAIEDSRLTESFVDSVFAGVAATEATVLVAENGEVFIDKSYGVPAQPSYMPTTTLPQFELGGLSDGYLAAAALMLEADGKLKLDAPLTPGGSVTVRQFLSGERAEPGGAAQLAHLIGIASGTSFQRFVTQRLFTPIGAHRTVAGDDGAFKGDVDELYRWELGLLDNSAFTLAGTDGAFKPSRSDGHAGLGWHLDTWHGLREASEYGTPDGGRNAFVKFPERRAAIIIVTNSDQANAGALAARLAERMLGSQ
ncbi:MAG TPA: Type 1 glutamine amidotransferase-like domain-containing protein, partial [Gemmatimonadaceae bacterium]